MLSPSRCCNRFVGVVQKMYKGLVQQQSSCVKTWLLLGLICVLLVGIGSALHNEGYTEAVAPDGQQHQLTGQLKFAHVIFRHGDRTPVDPYPTDPWNDRRFWSTGWGQITNRGKEQHYELGKWLRQRYGSLLSTKYSKDEIYVKSTDVDRTLMSAESNLAGLYAPQGDDIWNSNINWQPIPVHTMPENEDPVLAAKAPCAAFDYELSALEASSEFQALYAHYQDLFVYLSRNSGRPVKTFLDAQYLNNTLFIESLYNMTLPEWTRKVYGGADFTQVTNFAFSVNTYTRKLARLKAGPLLKDIFQRLKAKHSRTLNPDRSVWIYSAHDTTIANVLNALQLFELHSPPYTACIMVELRVDDANKPWVSIFYKNTTAEPQPLNIPNCGVSCPLNKLFSLYQDVLPDNWQRECQVSTMMLTYEEANLGAATGILILIIVCLLCASYGLMIYYRRRNYHLYNSYAQMA